MGEYLKYYRDQFKKAQQVGNFKMILFDVKDSKKWSEKDDFAFYEHLISFLNGVTKDLLASEKISGKKILHRHLESPFLYDIDEDKDKVILQEKQYQYLPKLYRFDCLNPLLWQGDMMHIIVLRNSISDEELFAVLQKNKDKYIPNYDLHYAQGYYETHVWAESGEKLSRIYCIPILEELAKTSNKLFQTKHHEKE